MACRARASSAQALTHLNAIALHSTADAQMCAQVRAIRVQHGGRGPLRGACGQLRSEHHEVVAAHGDVLERTRWQLLCQRHGEPAIRVGAGQPLANLARVPEGGTWRFVSAQVHRANPYGRAARHVARYESGHQQHRGGRLQSHRAALPQCPCHARKRAQ
jgi:hypothetical protein